jgi:hypothetical protein
MPKISQEQYDALKKLRDMQRGFVNTVDNTGERGIRIIGLRVPTGIAGPNSVGELLFLLEKAIGKD